MSELEKQCRWHMWLVANGKRVWSDKIWEQKMEALGNPLIRVDDITPEEQTEALEWYRAVQR